jgi:hypothetical protein
MENGSKVVNKAEEIPGASIPESKIKPVYRFSALLFLSIGIDYRQLHMRNCVRLTLFALLKHYLFVLWLLN